MTRLNDSLHIVLIDSFSGIIPPPFAGNLERMWFGLLKGKGTHQISVASCRGSFLEHPLADGIFRPNSFKALKDHLKGFDLLIVPSNLDWIIGGVRYKFEVCLREICSLDVQVAVLGQVATDQNVCALVRSNLELLTTKAKRVKVVRHCSHLKKSSLSVDERTVVMLGGVTQWSIEVAAKACQFLGRQLFVVGRHDLESAYGAVMLGEINEARKADLISQASACVYVKHPQAKPLGSPSLLEPGICGTPTIALDYGGPSTVSEYLGDSLILKEGTSGETTIQTLGSALKDLHVDRMSLQQQTSELYSCQAFTQNVLDAVFDDHSMWD